MLVFDVYGLMSTISILYSITTPIMKSVRIYNILQKHAPFGAANETINDSLKKRTRKWGKTL